MIVFVGADGCVDVIVTRGEAFLWMDQPPFWVAVSGISHPTVAERRRAYTLVQPIWNAAHGEVP